MTSVALFSFKILERTLRDSLLKTIYDYSDSTTHSKKWVLWILMMVRLGNCDNPWRKPYEGLYLIPEKNTLWEKLFAFSIDQYLLVLTWNFMRTVRCKSIVNLKDTLYWLPQYLLGIKSDSFCHLLQKLISSDSARTECYLCMNKNTCFDSTIYNPWKICLIDFYIYHYDYFFLKIMKVVDHKQTFIYCTLHTI